MSIPFRVTLLGDLNVDVVMPLPVYPQPGSDGFTEHVEMHPGGGVVNSAVVLQHLGFQTSILGATGSDLWADYLHAHLEPTGIDLCSLKQKTSAGTGLIFITVTPDGQRTMLCYRGANTLLEPQDLSHDCLNGTSLLHLSGYAFMQSPQLPLEPILQQPETINHLLEHLTLCVLGEDELSQLTGMPEDQAVQQLLSRGICRLAIKKGSRGCLLAEAGRSPYRTLRSLQLPIFPVASLDTTAAGDAFSAGFLAGWLSGLDLPTSGTLASALGALATTVYGGSTALPGLPELVQFIKHAQKSPSSQVFHPWLAQVLNIIQIQPGMQSHHDW
jgi:ribokinase